MITASDILHNADAFRPRAAPEHPAPLRPSGMSLGEQRARIRAILSGQTVPLQPRVLTAGEPVVLDGADPDADLDYAAERADFDNGEG
jgi:hypothetical protein